MSITWWDYTFCHILYENVTFFIDTAFASDKMLLSYWISQRICATPGRAAAQPENTELAWGIL